MRWIETKTFVGVDRRKRTPALQYGERRQESAGKEITSLGQALRQLQVRAPLTDTPRGVKDFAGRARLIADYVAAAHEPELAEQLAKLSEMVSAQPDFDWREKLIEALKTISERFDAKTGAANPQAAGE